MSAVTRAAVACAFAATFLIACTPPTEPPATTTTTTAPPAALEVDQLSPGDIANVGLAPSAPCGVAAAVETAQTFTAGRTGNLERVSVAAFTGYLPAGPLAVSVRPVDVNGPIDVELGAGTYDGPGLGYFNAVPSSSRVVTELVDINLDLPAPVVAGEQYALVFSVPSECGDVTAAPPYWALGADETSDADRYPGGSTWYRFLSWPQQWISHEV